MCYRSNLFLGYFCFNLVCFLMNKLNSWFGFNLPFLCQSDRKKEKNVVSFMHEQIIMCSQTQLDDITLRT